MIDDDLDLIDNYHALMLAVCNPDYTADKAISYFSPQVKDKELDGTGAELAELRKTMTYKQIGEMYGITDQAVYKRIQFWKMKAG